MYLDLSVEAIVWPSGVCVDARFLFRVRANLWTGLSSSLLSLGLHSRKAGTAPACHQSPAQIQVHYRFSKTSEISNSRTCLYFIFAAASRRIRKASNRRCVCLTQRAEQFLQAHRLYMAAERSPTATTQQETQIQILRLTLLSVFFRPEPIDHRSGRLCCYRPGMFSTW